MLKPQDIDFARLDYGTLSNDQRALVLRLAMERGCIERSAAVWRMMIAIVAVFRRMAAATVAWHAGYRRRRQRQLDAAALDALSDRALKDIGVARCEIDRLVVEDRRRAA